MQGFLLGMATGTTCLAYCTPILVPVLLGDGNSIGRNFALLGRFLLGRLAGYLVFAVLAWGANALTLRWAGWRDLLSGPTYIALAGLLAFYGLSNAPRRCAASLSLNKMRPCDKASEEKDHGRAPSPESQGTSVFRRSILFPVGLGFLTGLSICPPFLLALTEAARTGTLVGSLAFFLAFFLGTMLYFVPLPFLGTLNRIAALRIVGRLASLVMAVYYFAFGIILIAGGIYGS